MKSKGDLLKEEGIDQVLANESAEWRLNAILKMQEYCITHEEFMGEDVNKWCMEQGISVPHHPNVWGAIFRTALLRKDEEKVKIISYAKAKSVKSHSHVFPVYRSLSFPKLSSAGVMLSTREQIAKLQSDLKFKKISIDEFTEYLWGLACDTNTRIRFLE